jgi:hypothetical protein
MAVYVARGLFAVAGLCWAKAVYNKAVSISKLSEAENIVAEGVPVQLFAAEQAEKLGLKHLIVIKEDRIASYGMSLFGKIGVSVSSDTDLSQFPSGYTQFRITHMIAHIKSNDSLFATLIPVITSIFTLMALTSIAPIGATVAGFAVGTISGVIFSRWREKIADLTAMQNCCQTVNSAYLKFLREKQLEKSQESWLSLKRILFAIINSSIHQRIQYLEAFIAKQAEQEKFSQNLTC